MTIEFELNSPAKNAFLREYSRHGVVAPSCKVAGITRGMFNKWREIDEDFDQAVIDTGEDSVDEMELELRRRSLKGWNELVMYKGRQMYCRDPFSGQYLLDDNFDPIPLVVAKSNEGMLRMYMQGNRAKKYGTKQTVEMSGPEGGAIPVGIKVEYVLPDGKTAKDYGDALEDDPNLTIT